MYIWSASCVEQFIRGKTFRGTSMTFFEKGKTFWLLPGIQPRFPGRPYVVMSLQLTHFIFCPCTTKNTDPVARTVRGTKWLYIILSMFFNLDL